MVMYQDQVKAYYDYILPFCTLFWHGETQAVHYGIWDASTKNLQDALLNTNKVLAEKVDVQPGARVLDAGCGVGGSGFWLARNKAAYVVGVTISERQLATA